MLVTDDVFAVRTAGQRLSEQLRRQVHSTSRFPICSCQFHVFSICHQNTRITFKATSGMAHLLPYIHSTFLSLLAALSKKCVDRFVCFSSWNNSSHNGVPKHPSWDKCAFTTHFEYWFNTCWHQQRSPTQHRHRDAARKFGRVS